MCIGLNINVMYGCSSPAVAIKAWLTYSVIHTVQVLTYGRYYGPWRSTTVRNAWCYQRLLKLHCGTVQSDQGLLSSLDMSEALLVEYANYEDADQPALIAGWYESSLVAHVWRHVLPLQQHTVRNIFLVVLSCIRRGTSWLLSITRSSVKNRRGCLGEFKAFWNGN